MRTLEYAEDVVCSGIAFYHGIDYSRSCRKCCQKSLESAKGLFIGPQRSTFDMMKNLSSVTLKSATNPISITLKSGDEIESAPVWESSLISIISIIDMAMSIK